MNIFFIIYPIEVIILPRIITHIKTRYSLATNEKFCKFASN